LFWHCGDQLEAAELRLVRQGTHVRRPRACERSAGQVLGVGARSTKSDAGVDVVDLERAARCVWDPLVVHASRGVGGDAPNAMQQVFLRLAAQACRRSPQQLPHTAERPSSTPATDR